MRKYGVRFGAYHIYFPGLLKPAGRALAALLWALKQDNVDLSALSGAQHLASSGRTSFPVDKQLPRDAYRVLGYKQAGERAVRVDILERLADLIRPALAWRENASGEKPAGAFDGRSFVVTQAMTSLTGSAGEDFASVLRALGYRMEKRPPLPAKPVRLLRRRRLPKHSQQSAPQPKRRSRTPQRRADTAIEAAAEPVTVEDAPGMEQHDEPAHDEPALEAFPVTPEDAPGIAPPAEEAAAPRRSCGSRSRRNRCNGSRCNRSRCVADAAGRGRGHARRARAHRGLASRRPSRRSQAAPRAPSQPASPQPRPQAAAEAGAAPAEGEAAQPPTARSAVSVIVMAAVIVAMGQGLPQAARRWRRSRAASRGARRQEPPLRGQGMAATRIAIATRASSAAIATRAATTAAATATRAATAQGGPSLRPYASSATPRERDRPVDPNSPFAKLAALKEQLSGRKE